MHSDDKPFDPRQEFLDDDVEALREAFKDDPDVLAGIDEVLGDETSDSSAAQVSTQVPGQFSPTSDIDLMHKAAEKHLIEISDQPEVSLRQIYGDLLGVIHAFFTIENARRKEAGGNLPKLTSPKDLPESIMVKVLLARFPIRAIALRGGVVDSSHCLLGIYCDDLSDDRYGCYITDEAAIRRLAYDLKLTMTSNAAESLLKALKDHAPVVSRTREPHLIPVANGIFDHSKQELMPFSPDYVFLAKSPVRYVPDAENPVITQPDGEPWDVESWIDSLSDDEGVPELLWEIISAVVRPGVRWDKAAFFYSERGNNGKGTLCGLMTSLVGEDAAASIPMSAFGEEFKLEELIHAMAIITDENATEAYAKQLDKFKAIVTGDKFQLNRKHQSVVSMRFLGMVVQCVNGFPKSADKSDSFYRRQLWIPFKKWFGGDGVERKWIKADYLKRPEVLEYVLMKALHMQHTDLSEPETCRDLLEDFKLRNDPVKDFWDTFRQEFTWDLLPTGFLHELFQAWFRKTHPSGIPISINEFSSRLQSAVETDEIWDFSDTKKKHRPAGKMAVAEPLVLELGLENWQNSTYSGNDPNMKALPSPLKTNYCGVVRI